jgi:fucose 4-O-acetylase-like acetyltransferase
MFKRILHEDWAMIVPMVSFFLIFGVFAVATIRALRMSRSNREHLASLPLDLDEESNTPQP